MRWEKPNLQPLPGSVAESVAARFFQAHRQAKRLGERLVAPVTQIGNGAPFLFLTWLRVTRQKALRLRHVRS